jgi:hypothetical protein
MRGFLPANLFFKMCLVLRVFDAYQMRKKYFSYWGCLLPLLIYGYMRIFFKVAFRQEVMVTSTTSKIFFAVG